VKIGLMGALPQELNLVLAQAQSQGQPDRCGGREFWSGNWHGHDFVAVLSRIGKVAAASTAALLIERHRVDVVLFTGVAGGLGPGVRIGDAVVASEFLQHDLDASPLFARHVIPLDGVSRLPADPDWSQRLFQAACSAQARMHADWPGGWQGLDLSQGRVHHGLIISGDRFVSRAGESEQLRTELPDALAVEMEGAAVAQVCRDHGIPFGAVRLISDRADDQAHPDFLRLVNDLAAPFGYHLIDHLLRENNQKLGSDPNL
jgi:adenosylhomocysteine nucleosidase